MWSLAVLPIHLAFSHVMAEPRRKVLRVVRAYAHKVWEKYLRVRSPITDLLSYMLRSDDLTKAMREVLGVVFFSQAPDISPDVVWDAVDRLARRKDGQYSKRAGHYPRLGTFGDAFIGYEELGEDQKKEIIKRFCMALVEKYGCAVEAVYHSRDGITIDHFHILATDRFVTAAGVGPKNREINGIASKVDGDGVVEGNLRYAGFIEFARNTFADLLREFTGLPFVAASYARQGLGIEPVRYVSKARTATERRAGHELWREERAAFMALRNAAAGQSVVSTLPAEAALSRESVERLAVELSGLAPNVLDVVRTLSHHLSPMAAMALATDISNEPVPTNAEAVGVKAGIVAEKTEVDKPSSDAEPVGEGLDFGFGPIELPQSRRGPNLGEEPAPKALGAFAEEHLAQNETSGAIPSSFGNENARPATGGEASSSKLSGSERRAEPAKRAVPLPPRFVLLEEGSLDAPMNSVAPRSAPAQRMTQREDFGREISPMEPAAVKNVVSSEPPALRPAQAISETLSPPRIFVDEDEDEKAIERKRRRGRHPVRRLDDDGRGR